MQWLVGRLQDGASQESSGSSNRMGECLGELGPSSSSSTTLLSLQSKAIAGDDAQFPKGGILTRRAVRRLKDCSSRSTSLCSDSCLKGDPAFVPALALATTTSVNLLAYLGLPVLWHPALCMC